MKKKVGCHDGQADFYDKSVRENSTGYIRENYFNILNTVINSLNLENKMKVLDIGIGTGLLTERMPNDLELYGIDISEKMMDKIKEKSLKVNLQIGNFCNIPFQDKYFDRIVSTFAFHHLKDKEKEEAFIEMDRVLKPYGYLVIGDFMIENDEEMNLLIKKFTNENRNDMLQELQDENFTNIKKTIKFLHTLNYDITYKKGSTLTWILSAQKCIR